MRIKYFIIICFILCSSLLQAQSLLDKQVTIDVKRQRLDQVLEIISNQGQFYFSYNSAIIKKDSLVSLSISKPLMQVLQALLPDHYEFRESGNYVIIRKAPIKVTLSTVAVKPEQKFYSLSGYVLDEGTASWIRQATVYEKNQLASAQTNEGGYFKLKLRQKIRRPFITVSKEFYQDTSFTIDGGNDQQITVTLVPLSSQVITVIGPDDYFAPDQLKLRVVRSDSSIAEYTYLRPDSLKVEATGMARFLLSSRQRFQSLNLRRFFTTRPYQVSLTPGLGTHGYLSAQVINNFSLNVLGGYNGGVRGVEVGGLFNLDKKDVSFLQAAGLFNIVGGKVRGLQVAGVSNTVLDSVTGLQAAGVHNYSKGHFKGFQISGVYNHAADSVTGMQASGVGNFSNRNVRGVQLAGVINVAGKEVKGAQISGVINYARKLKGVQIGLINISDSSEGVGIGLINVVLHGYHKLAFYSDEVVNANVAFKTGSHKLYNILHAGMNFSDSNEVFSFGYGLGSQLQLSKRISLNPEITAQHLYLGSWDFANILSKARLNLNIGIGKYVTLFGGPVFNVYYSNQDVSFTGYRKSFPPKGYRDFRLGNDVKGWIGWNAGISFF